MYRSRRKMPFATAITLVLACMMQVCYGQTCVAKDDGSVYVGTDHGAIFRKNLNAGAWELVLEATTCYPSPYSEPKLTPLYIRRIVPLAGTIMYGINGNYFGEWNAADCVGYCGCFSAHYTKGVGWLTHPAGILPLFEGEIAYIGSIRDSASVVFHQPRSYTVEPFYVTTLYNDGRFTTDTIQSPGNDVFGDVSEAVQRGNTLLLFTSDGVYRTADRGGTWDLTLRVQPTAFYESTDMLVLGSYTDVYVSVDTGKTWNSSITALADSLWVRHLVSVGDTIVVAASIRHGYPDMAAVLVSEDKGRTWEKRPVLTGCRSLTHVDSGIVAGRVDGLGKRQLLVTYDLCQTWEEWVESINLWETAIRKPAISPRQIAQCCVDSPVKIGLACTHDHAGDQNVLYDIRGRMIYPRQGRQMGIQISHIRRPANGVR